ncbi:NAD(P)-dependent oxidoreductase [Polynucleobacter sp. SHI8]|uniref:dTDP-4-dehydrorhamnose reductase n=1 Tax=unclassified Polynucleobacter TaxID=2640945 RepID=UPI00249002B6|nr:MULTISPECIES: dTDP-4-dehydrorhamnose reductase [unclassified Polynucleobacter]BDW10212.1 NAD(P)-dependent oxidoreductase [Polynucleobacter sp. SHI2]BDW12658.1 NAD(P)-dependent oxidoreductase [Polynucleobacter sp. SHI8]
MNILVFGKDGQVGKALQNQLINTPHTSYVGRSECDLSKSEQIQATLNQYQPQIIINASAYTAVDQAEKEPDLAHAINGIAPSIMAEYISNVHGGVFIHYSTDYVFDGLKQSLYQETDTPNPLSQYGKSKLAGENKIQEIFKSNPNSTARYLILRTSWVYGDGGNFIKTMLRLASERDQLKVIADQYGVPSSADWLAQKAIDLLSSDVKSGIYHTVTDGETTWHGLASFVVQTATELGYPIKVAHDAIQAIPATDYPLPAPRPYNSRMNNRKLKDALHVEHFPQWKDQVAEYVKKVVSEQKSY